MKQITLTGAVALFGLGAFSVASHADTKVTVQSGDTLSEIANANNTSVSELKDLNNINNINLIYVGDTLVVSKDSSDTQAVVQPTEQVSQPVDNSVQAQPVANTTQEDTTDYGVYTNPQIYANRWDNADNTTQVTPTVSSGSEQSAKEWIANKESGGNYNIANSTGSGAYGKYQLMNLPYGTSPEAQERAADEYVANRYGSWANAQAFHETHNYY